MQTAISNAYEKEIETLLSNANSVITKQKEQITRAQEGTNWKDKIRQLEQEHIAEREASQQQFKDYKVALLQKEQALEQEHRNKVAEMKTEVADLKKGFDTRVLEFKKQVEEFKKNNEAIEALKKAHAKELADHV